MFSYTGFNVDLESPLITWKGDVITTLIQSSALMALVTLKHFYSFTNTINATAFEIMSCHVTASFYLLVMFGILKIVPFGSATELKFGTNKNNDIYECSICTMAAFTRIPKLERYKLEELQNFKFTARYGLPNTHNDNNDRNFARFEKPWTL
uniref:Uncharacterized protein n=1 Tax=Glossina pallidipes TaxID=7398 RepID=A0A1A9ZS23_GLOPL